MFFKQYFLACLAQASYMIGDGGEAAVIDPRRDVDIYLDEAAAAGLRIKYIIETHFHADFVSGHLELAARSGAEIVFGSAAHPEYPALHVADGHVLTIGGLSLRILETPGHTPESICILAIEGGKPRRLFTGDTLFIGDVGRPDLVGSKGFTAQEMAGRLYDSLHDKILPLDDAVEVWPGHGAGSACGRNISTDTSSTIGAQRRFNHALADMPREAFVDMMTRELAAPPRYFADDAELNRSGARPLSELTAVGRLDAQAPEMAGCVVVDVRDAATFGAGHLGGALNLGLSGQFASWAASLLGLETPIVIAADDRAQVDEARMRLARVGVESVRGWIGPEAWDGRAATLPQMTVRELAASRGSVQIIDVRREGEFRCAHVTDAVLRPLATLESSLDGLDPQRPTAVICRSGYRSSAAASILKTHGFHDVHNVEGGMVAWEEAVLPVIAEEVSV